ncbi:HNH endonuclease signature motif containing protein [Bdellovibrionota bacterium FG-2]
MSQRQLEKEVAKIRPQAATPERASYVSENRVKIEIGLSEKDMLALRRVQDLLSQARRRAVSLEETIVTMTEEHLRRRDPVRRAKRQIAKKGALVGAISAVQDARPVSIQARAQRVPIPANLLHQVRLRDQGRCTYIADTSGTPGASTHGKRCNQSRWIEIHHTIPISEGGTNTLENLTSLCSLHHNWTHSTA